MTGIVRCYGVARQLSAGVIIRPIGAIRRFMTASLASPARVALVFVTLGAPLAALPPMMLGGSPSVPAGGESTEGRRVSGSSNPTGPSPALVRSITETPSPRTLPEPSAIVLLGAGLVALWAVRRLGLRRAKHETNDYE